MRPEIHAVILWSNALPQRDRLVTDLAEHVELVASYRVAWPPERFAENLVRLYGFQLPERVDKVAGGGDQPVALRQRVRPEDHRVDLGCHLPAAASSVSRARPRRPKPSPRRDA